MKRFILSMIRVAAAAVLGAACAAAQSTVTQTFALQPGWNSIYLETQPDDTSPETVFQGLPADAWAWLDVTSAVEFIQDPAEGLTRRSGWHGYLSDPAHRFLTNLHAVHANRAYLIHLRGNAPATLTVTGRPVLRPLRWVPDSFNLTGFPLDPNAADKPTFGELLAPSAAHRGQAIYRLATDGTWVFVSAAEKPEAGKAYWFYCEGASDYQGLLAVAPAVGGGLDYGKDYSGKDLTISGWSLNGTSLSLTLNASDPVLAVRGFDPDLRRITWQTLPYDFTLEAATLNSLGATAPAVRRLALAVRGVTGTAAAVLEIKGAGMLYRVPVSAQQ